MPCKRDSLSIGALLGNLEGVSFAENCERNEKYIWVLFLEPEVIKVLILSEAKASLRITYQGYFFLDPKDIMKLNIVAIWNRGKRNRAPLT